MPFDPARVYVIERHAPQYSSVGPSSQPLEALKMDDTRLSLAELLKSDLERYFHYYGKPGRNPRKRDLWRNFIIPRCAPVAIYRLASACERGGWHAFSKLITWINFYLYGVEILAECDIGPHFFMPHASGTVIGAKKIGRYAVIYHQVTIGAKEIDSSNTLRPIIGDNVMIASGAKVLGQIEIGDRCVIGANAVVTKSAESDSLLTGIPARARARKP